MDERDDLVARLRDVEDALALVQPRARHEARLRAKLRAAERAPQPRSPSPSALLAVAVGRAWRPVCAAGALCAALALVLRAGDPGPESAQTATTSGRTPSSRERGENNDDKEAAPTSAELAPHERASWPRSQPAWRGTERSELPSERAPQPRESEPSEAAWAAPHPPAPLAGDGPKARPRGASRDEPPPQNGEHPPDREHGIPGAQRPQAAPTRDAHGAPEVLWMPGLPDAPPTPANGLEGRAGLAGSGAGPRASGCERAERLLERAQERCEAQALTLSERELTYLEECGKGLFGGLEYSCVSTPEIDLSLEAPPGCIVDEIPPEGACKEGAEIRVEAIHWCDEAGLTLAQLTLINSGGCGDGFDDARFLCCESEHDENTRGHVPRAKSNPCTADSGSECAE